MTQSHVTLLNWDIKIMRKEVVNLSKNVIQKYLIILTFTLAFVFSANSVTAHAEEERTLTGIEAVSDVKEIA